MDLDAITFPALIIADDGWVEFLKDPHTISVWNRGAIIKYSKRCVTLYDSVNQVWRIERIVPHNPISLISKLLALTFYNPRVPVRIEVRRIEESPLEKLRGALESAIEADDDILTQETEADRLKELVRQPGSFKELVAVLKKAHAI